MATHTTSNQKPGWRSAINEHPKNQLHWWNGKTFAQSGRPVAECHNEIELFPRVVHPPVTTSLYKCMNCYSNHNAH